MMYQSHSTEHVLCLVTLVTFISIKFSAQHLKMIDPKLPGLRRMGAGLVGRGGKFYRRMRKVWRSSFGETTTNAALPLSLPVPSSAQVGSKEGSGGSAGWVSKQDTWAPWECPVEGKITPELEEGIQSSLTYYVYSLTYHKQSFCIELKGED